MGKQLFGTDGIRGVAGEYPLDPATVYAFGLALGHDAARVQSSPEILIGADTRESGGWIAELVAGGLEQAGARVRYAGVITTPGVAYLTRSGPFLAGVMISASHNPYQDNGLKVFAHNGFKLPDEEEQIVEQEILRLRDAGVTPKPATLEADGEWDRQLPGFPRVSVDRPAGGRQAGNGLRQRRSLPAGSGTVPRIGRGSDHALLRSPMAAISIWIAARCTWKNLQDAVLAAGADFGVAFDGDADRAIFVARSGKVVNGDAVMLVLARAMKAAGHLKEDTLVSTVMSNLGLEKALERAGIRMVRMPVGDKYVLEEMVRLGASLGGEQSGHVILREFATTGDGMLTALRVFETVRELGAGLDELTADLQVYPQKLVNVRVREKKELTELPSVAREIEHVETAFAGTGRVLVRFSGTEPLARVMVEGQDPQQVEQFSARIADAIRLAMGS